MTAGKLNLVFPNGIGNPESHSNILSRIFWPIQLAAGVVVVREGKDKNGSPLKFADAKFSLHALRHAAAALWIEQGLSPKRIQSLMGHASIMQTYDTYGYLLEAREADAGAMAEIAAKLI